MKKRALRKDFYVEIRKSLGRFLSIFFIVAMGVAFLSGIRASEPDMRYSGDAYFDRNNLMDIKVIGTLGLKDRDVKALEAVEGVDKAEPGYASDVLVDIDGNQKVVHAMSVLPSMNQSEAIDGRMPEKQGECLVDIDFCNQFGLKVGDSITLLSGTKDPITDTFKRDTFKIVGCGSSSAYISFGRGSSNIGNGEIEGFLVVLPEDFAMDVYTECNVTVEGAKELTAFTKEYDEAVEIVQKNIEKIEAEQGKIRADEIREEANKELADAEKKYEEAKKETEEKLADALKKLTDGEQELADGKLELENAKQELADGKAKLEQSQKEVDAAKQKIAAGWLQLEAGRREFAQKEQEFNRQYADGMAQIQAEIELAAAWGEFKTKEAQYETILSLLTEAKNELASRQSELESGTVAPENVVLVEMEIKVLQEAIARFEPQLQTAGAELEAGRTKLIQAQAEADKGKAQLEAGKAAIDQARQKLDSSAQELIKGQLEADLGQSQIDSGWIEIEAGEKEIQAGEEEIKKNEKKLKDARKEYEDGKKDAEKELKNARNEIKDAKAELAKLEDAEWYIEDREVIADYIGYGDNADRMRAIGEVFPILFFIVAALISLTTMTRMVEEQRIQIGTLKALGYGKFSIAGKYLNYALLATISGSVAGVFIGEKIFPYIIVTAYKIMYPHLPDVVIPYDWGYAAFATGAAVICTGLATLLACYKELASQPAVLMRPPTPKQGKRVFLEYVPFIWKRLGFIWKSTIRNLIRYKKRFFMTVFGIGGCMALMIVGFGLRDSIFAITKIQYKELQTYDGMVILNEDADQEDREELNEYLTSEDEIASISEGFMKKTSVRNGELEKEVYLYAPSDLDEVKEFLTFRSRLTKEQYELGEDDVILTEKMAKLLDLKKGEKISVEIEEDEWKELEITNICENYMENYLYISSQTYEKLYGKTMEVNNIYFKMQNFDEKKLGKLGEKILEERAALSVAYTYSMEGQLDDMLKALDIVIVVLIISAGLLAFVVLYNLNNINITERKRELATIKVLGFYDNEVCAYVYRENILLTIIGVIIGIVLGSILHRYVIVTVEIERVMFTRIIEVISFVYSALLTCAFSVFVNVVMYFKLKKINMVESLKSVE